MRVVAVQVSLTGLYRAPVFKRPMPAPPQMTISLPVQTTAAVPRAAGAFTVLTLVQVLVAGLYLPPLVWIPVLFCPPQIIISVPVHTAG